MKANDTCSGKGIAVAAWTEVRALHSYDSGASRTEREKSESAGPVLLRRLPAALSQRALVPETGRSGSADADFGLVQGNLESSDENGGTMRGIEPQIYHSAHTLRGFRAGARIDRDPRSE